MTEEIYCERLTELKREKNFLEKNLKVKITIKRKKIIIKGEPLDEYEALMVLDAINLGFSARKSCSLKDEDMIFERLNIKDHTRRKNLEIVRGRLIGTHGKTKETIEKICNCEIKIKGNIVGIIAPAESIEYITTAITNLIRGTKQTNIYKYLERINTQRKKLED